MKKKEFEKYYQQNSLINQEISKNQEFREIKNKEDKQDTQIITSKKDKKGRKLKSKSDWISVTAKLFYDDNVKQNDSLLVDESEKLTPYDMFVYDMISTCWENGKKSIKLKELYRMMTGYRGTNPNKEQLRKIIKSIMKMTSVWISMDLKQEYDAGMIEEQKMESAIETGKMKRQVVTSQLLYARFNTEVKEEDEFPFNTKVIIMIEPILLTYNKARHTLITVSVKCLSQGKLVDKTIGLRTYLIARISGFKNGNLSQNKICFETIYKNSGFEIPESKHWWQEKNTLKRIMDNLKDEELIIDYDFIGYDIVFNVKNGQS